MWSPCTTWDLGKGPSGGRCSRLGNDGGKVAGNGYIVGLALRIYYTRRQHASEGKTEPLETLHSLRAVNTPLIYDRSSYALLDAPQFILGRRIGLGVEHFALDGERPRNVEWG